MKAARLTQPADVKEEPLDIIDIEIPEPKENQVLIKVNACGVCHTDLHLVEGEIRPPSYPITPGHQIVGEIVLLGENVHRWRVGDRVGLPWLYESCGECEHCRAGRENLCDAIRFTGFHVDGGFAEYVIGEEDYILSIPGTMTPEKAAPLLCAGIIGYRSLKQADLQPGERLGLFGFGASAHLTIQVARHWDCEVYVFTRSEEHKKHARQLGARWVGEADDQPPVKLDSAVTFAPVGWIVPKALEKIRPGGTVAINAIFMTPIPEFEYQLIYQERTLRSVTNATYTDGVEYLELANEIGIEVTTKKYSLEDVNQALADIKESRINGEAVLVL